MKITLTISLQVILIALATSSADATVVVSCRDLGGGIAEFSYDALTESLLVRAFALNITVDHGATIESIFDYKVGESTVDDPGYGIFAGTIQIDPQGNVVDWGTPIAPTDSPGADGTGLGTNKIVVEMGSLYNSEENAPLLSDTLFKISIDWHNAILINVSIAENPERGGIVMENPNINPVVQLVGCTLVPEPSTLLLLGLGVPMLSGFRKKR